MSKPFARPRPIAFGDGFFKGRRTSGYVGDSLVSHKKKKKKKKKKSEMAARIASGADSVSMSEIRGIRVSARRGGSQKRRTLFRELYREANPTFRWRDDKPVSFSRMGMNYRCDD